MTQPAQSITSPATGRAYRLDEVIGKGGFGTVWRGQVAGQHGFVKPVAIKVLNADVDALGELGQRLRDEARLLGLLRHQSIIQVDDLVELDGRWAVIMEYIEGADLAALLRLGPLPLRVACEVATEVATALAIAHEARDPSTGNPLRIVHRDIKPANIRITRAGEVKVLDFGIARAEFVEREAQTRSVSFGSVGYLAPERYDGEEGPPVDIYALGVVLHLMVTGRFMGQLSPNPSRHDQALKQALSWMGEAPAALVDLVRQMMAFDTEDRPNAREVRRALRDVAASIQGPWLIDEAGSLVDRALALARNASERPAASPAPRAAEAALSAGAPSPVLPTEPAAWNPVTGPARTPPLRQAPATGPIETRTTARRRPPTYSEASTGRGLGWFLVTVVVVVCLIVYYNLRNTMPWSDATAWQDLNEGHFIKQAEPDPTSRPPEFQAPTREPDHR